MNTFEFEIWIGRLNELSTRQRSLLEGLLAGVGPSPRWLVIELVEKQARRATSVPALRRGASARLGQGEWPAAASLRRLPSYLQCPDRHAAGAVAS